MSYTQVTGPPATVDFHYLTASLFGSVSARSLYIAKGKKNDAGEPAIAEYAILEDETPQFLEYLRKACNDVFSIFANLTYELTDTETFNVIYNAVEGTESVTKTINDKEGYKTDILRNIDGDIDEMLKLHVLDNWFKNCGLYDESKVFGGEYTYRKRQLLDKIFKLHKPLLT